MRPAFWILHDTYGVDYENAIGTYRLIRRDHLVQGEVRYCDSVQDSWEGTASKAGYIQITFCESADESTYEEGLILGFDKEEHLAEMMNRLADCIMNHKHCLDGRGLDFLTMIIQ